MRKINKIIIHCSATCAGVDYTVDDIRRWHRKRGFSDIGYHYVIYRDGSIHKGRPLESIGAHCSGQNAKSIGICYIGGMSRNGLLPEDTRTEAQRRALDVLVSDLVNRFPYVTIHGHNEFANKACPCFDVSAEYQSYNQTSLI